MYINPGLNPSAPPPPGMARPVAGQSDVPPAEQPEIGEPHENDDGSIDFLDEPETPEPHDVEHDANLAEALPDDVLADIAEQLVDGIDADTRSNQGMYDTFEAGLKFVRAEAGKRIDTPFPGAIGVVHPLLLEALVRFQAHARGEMLPASGPVRTQVNGDEQPDTEARAARKKDWLNYYLTQKDEDYYSDFDQMLFLLGIHGSMFRKVYRDPSRRGQPVSRALTPRDLLVSYSAMSLTDERVTHIQPNVSHADLIKLQLKGWYCDVEIERQPAEEETESSRAKGEAEGREASDRLEDATYTLYHSHCLLDIKGLEHRDMKGEPTGLPLPYIVTLEKETRTVLRIARNWAEGDDEFEPREYYSHFKYMPGLGFYGWGLVHLLGSTVDALTAMWRLAINNMIMKGHPGGVKVKGAAKTEQSRIVVGPGEFHDIDTGGMPIQQAMMPMPYADLPAGFQPILQEMLEAGQRLGSVGDMAVGEGREDALPGTVIALIEQAKALEASVIKRLHTAQRKELRLLADLFGADPDAVYPYRVGGRKGQAVAADFQDNEDIIPVSDPNVPTQTQRLAQAQAVLTMSRQPGSGIDARGAESEFLRVLGKSDQDIQRLMPPPGQGQPSDPITEFAALMKGMPLAAGPPQDHAAHIQSHVGQLSHPLLQVPAAAAQKHALEAHIADHMGLHYAAEASRLTGVPMLPGQIPPQQEAQVTAAVAAATGALREAMLTLAPPNGDPLQAMKLQLDAKKLHQTDQKMILDAHEQDRKAAQDHADRQADINKTAATLADNVQQRATEQLMNQEETIRSILSLRTAQVSAGADVQQEAMARETGIAEHLIQAASGHERAMADVTVAAHDHAAANRQAKADERVAAHEKEAERHRVKAEQAKAASARAKASKPKPKGKK